MKKILFFLLLTLAARPAFPQEPEHPLTFNGVPMGGPIDEFVSEMEKRGLKLSDWNLEHADWSLKYMTGDFAGFLCNLIISPMFGKTWLILVNFPEYKSWEPLQIIYEGLQKKLIDKYGEPAEVVEEFRTDRQPETDSMRMAALHADQCRYFTRFDFDRQSIELSINNYRGDSVYMNYISLRYLTSIPEIGFINDPETDTIPAAENSVRNNNQ